MPKFLVVDDHAVVREGLKQILREGFPRASFGEAGNCQEFVARAGEEVWDLVILDLSLPGRGGLEALAEVKTLHPKLAVLVLSIHANEHYILGAFRLGAAGYLTKDSAAKELLSAAKKILAGGRYVSPPIAEKLAQAVEGNAERLPHKKLSSREYQVMLLIASGKTVTKVAEELHLSPKTISTYRTRILEKMRMNTSAELTHYAFKNRLLE